MLQGELTKEQIAMLKGMLHRISEKEGPDALPIIGDIIRNLQGFKAEEPKEEIDG